MEGAGPIEARSPNCFLQCSLRHARSDCNMLCPTAVLTCGAVSRKGINLRGTEMHHSNRQALQLKTATGSADRHAAFRCRSAGPQHRRHTA